MEVWVLRKHLQASAYGTGFLADQGVLQLGNIMTYCSYRVTICVQQISWWHLYPHLHS